MLGCTPSYALHLASVMQEQGIDPAATAVRIIICMGEPLPKRSEARIRELWDAEIPRHAPQDGVQGQASLRSARAVTDSEHRQTLGMPDVLDEYPVPGPRSLDGVLGFRITELGEKEARAEAPVVDAVRQRFGLVHGGVYSALAEMVATEATVHGVWGSGNRAMGLSNATNFVRPITDGTIHAHAHRRHGGRTTWVWDVDFTDDAGRLCATSRVTVAVRPR